MRRGKWTRLATLIVALGAVAFISAACASIPGAAGPVAKPTLKLVDTQFDSGWLNNAIAKYVIEKGYGYPVETVETTTVIAQASLANGELDVWMELWQQNWQETYDKELAAGNIQNLGPTYEAGPQFFTIPRWVAEQYNIKTVEDMKRPEVVKLFQNPENPAKGAFINCITGWQCAEINRAKFRAYELDKYYDMIDPGSSGALDAALAGPQKRHEPVFGYYWAPTALIGMFDWYVLQEPAYSKECWAEVLKGRDDKNYTPKQACAYPTLPVDKGINKGMQHKAPDVVELLKKMEVGLEPINKTLAWAKEHDVKPSSEQAAIYYLRTYESRWTTWMPADRVQKVKEALAQAG